MQSSRTERQRPKTDPPQEWILGPSAARILGVDRHILPSLVARGLLTRRAVPGTYARYLRSDVEALLRQSTTEATALKR